jgi:hypothetical protein
VFPFATETSFDSVHASQEKPMPRDKPSIIRRKTAHWRLWTLSFALALVVPVPALAEPCPDEAGLEAECVAESPWYDANRLAVHFASADGEADWLFELASGSEYRITLDEKLGDAPVVGVIMVVGGQVMISKGLELELGGETDSLDAPALVQQLTLKLLQHAYPQGREQVLGVENFRMTRNYLYLTAATSRASAEFAPPWTVTGKIDNGNFDYVDFELDFEAPDVDYRAQFSGRWEKLVDPVAFPDSMIIEDWRVWPLVPQPDPPPFRPGWTARDMRIVTLGDLRRIMGGG